MPRASVVLAPRGLHLAVAPEPACVSLPLTSQPPILATHVKDWRDEVIYQLITDRFADGDVNNDYAIQPGSLGRYQGGDWLGIQNHLDYLQALGVTTLWISPVVVNVDTDAGVDGYHGYWATDLTQPNKFMGDLASLRSMVASAHELGMKVVLDIVCNHMGQVFFYDMNLNGQPDDYIEGNGTTSPLTQINEFDPDWNPLGVQASSSNGPDGRAPLIFLHDPTIDREPPQPGILGTAAAYHGFGRAIDFTQADQRLLGDFTGGLKDLATEIPEVRATLVDSYAKWVESVDFDGFRIDTVKHVENGFWQTFAPAVRSRLAAEGKNNFILFGEAFDGDDVLLGSYTAPGMLDSMFYFSQHYTAFASVFENAHLGAPQQAGTQQIQTLWDARSTNYGSTPQKGGVVGANVKDQVVGVPPTKLLVNFIDNHDVDRFLFDAAGDVPALQERAHAALRRGRDPGPLLRNGAELPRRQRSGEPRSLVGHRLRHDDRRHLRLHRQARAHPPDVRGSPARRHARRLVDHPRGDGIRRRDLRVRAGGGRRRGVLCARRLEHERGASERDVERRRADANDARAGHGPRRRPRGRAPDLHRRSERPARPSSAGDEGGDRGLRARRADRVSGSDSRSAGAGHEVSPRDGGGRSSKAK